jgi:hypothetical protein
MRVISTQLCCDFNVYFYLSFFLTCSLIDQIAIVHDAVNVEKGIVFLSHSSCSHSVEAVPLPTIVILIVILFPLSLLIRRLEIDQIPPNHPIRKKQKEQKNTLVVSRSFQSHIGVERMNV